MHQQLIKTQKFAVYVLTGLWIFPNTPKIPNWKGNYVWKYFFCISVNSLLIKNLEVADSEFCGLLFIPIMGISNNRENTEFSRKFRVKLFLLHFGIFNFTAGFQGRLFRILRCDASCWLWSFSEFPENSEFTGKFREKFFLFHFGKFIII